MSASLARTLTTFATLTAALAVGPRAHAQTVDGQEIPARLVLETDSAAIPPPPHCSKCKIKATTKTADAPLGGALLEIDYDDDVGDFVGVIELTILLTDGGFVRRTIEDVDMVVGEQSAYELGPESVFSWSEDVDHILVEVVADQ